MAQDRISGNLFGAKDALLLEDMCRQYWQKGSLKLVGNLNDVYGELKTRMIYDGPLCEVHPQGLGWELDTE